MPATSTRRARHLLAIINDILDIAKIESGKMEVEPQLLDPRLVIQSALRVLLVRAREKHQNMRVQIADDVTDAFADERAFKQIVINLGTNAVKFTQEGGEIVISGRRMADGGFELCVADNGPGISPALLDRIFTPFNQIDNRYNRQAGGTGLGLSLVRGLAELHGGTRLDRNRDRRGRAGLCYISARQDRCRAVAQHSRNRINRAILSKF